MATRLIRLHWHLLTDHNPTLKCHGVTFLSSFSSFVCYPSWLLTLVFRPHHTALCQPTELPVLTCCYPESMAMWVMQGQVALG